MPNLQLTGTVPYSSLISFSFFNHSCSIAHVCRRAPPGKCKHKPVPVTVNSKKIPFVPVEGTPLPPHHDPITPDVQDPDQDRQKGNQKLVDVVQGFYYCLCCGSTLTGKSERNGGMYLGNIPGFRCESGWSLINEP